MCGQKWLTAQSAHDCAGREHSGGNPDPPPAPADACDRAPAARRPPARLRSLPANRQRPLELRDRIAVRACGPLRKRGQRPAKLPVVLDIEAELFGKCPEPPIVIAPLSAGVLHPAAMGKPVRGLV